MALLSRSHVLVEVPTAEAALDEAEGARVDVLLAAQRLPGAVSGLELARLLAQKEPSVPVIVLADAGDPLPSPGDLATARCQFFMRPVAEPFLRGLRAALNGEREPTPEVPGDGTNSLPAYTPPLDASVLRGMAADLVRDAGALGGLVIDRSGRVVAEVGATGAIDRDELVVLAGPALAGAGAISPLIGGNAWAMHYYDGERLDIFGLALGVHYFVCLLFDGSNRGALGPVMMYGRRAADRIVRELGPAAYEMRLSAAPSAPGKAANEVADPPLALPPAPAAPDLQARQTADSGAESLEQVAAELEELDLDALFGQMVDENLAAIAFDPDDLGTLAAQLGDDGSDHVGYSDALDMGILDN
jgi:hypothetical protein